MAVQLAIEQMKRDQATQELFAKLHADREEPARINDPRIDIILIQMLEFTDKLMHHRRKEWWRRLIDYIRGD